MKLLRAALLTLVSLLPCHLACASLTFAHALELALERNGTAGQSTSRSCPIRLQDFAGVAAKLASANEQGLLPEGPAVFASRAEPSGEAFAIRSRRGVILCTALLYAKLEGIEDQRRILSQQVSYVRRLFYIESLRVSSGIDDPYLLNNAKLLRARTHMESVALTISERKTLTALSQLVGPLPDSADLAESSMPPLADSSTMTLENRETLRQLMASRDIVQLDYVSGYMHRLKATHDMVLARDSISNLVAAHVSEDIKLSALLESNREVQEAKLQFLGESDALADWALGRATSIANQSFEPLANPPSNVSSQLVSLTAATEQTPSLLSILLVPAIEGLQVGKSQQFSVIATYSNGRARDVTAEANWSCSNEMQAVLSSTGLLTGLSTGMIAVHVEFNGLSHSREFAISEQTDDEYLSAEAGSTIP